jgi:hypothetical protein
MSPPGAEKICVPTHHLDNPLTGPVRTLTGSVAGPCTLAKVSGMGERQTEPCWFAVTVSGGGTAWGYLLAALWAALGAGILTIIDLQD